MLNSSVAVDATHSIDAVRWMPGTGRSSVSLHDRAARAAALDDGLLSEEVDEVLAGRRIVDAFPVRRGESPPAYAVRAVAEMMVAYLR